MHNQSSAKLRVLVCPLDWGLGHATRCIPLVHALLNRGADVVIAADGPGSALLKEEFPALQHVAFRGYRIRFNQRLGIGLSLILMIPRLLIRVINEHYELKRLVKEYNIDVVISDNRYGLWSKSAYSVLVTHQPNIIPPTPIAFGAGALRWIVRCIMRKYKSCWIPDSEIEPSLSGKLSHGHKLTSNTVFIGLISRFVAMPNTGSVHKYDVVALVSGPEPFRLAFEKELTDQLSKLPLKSLLLKGTVDNSEAHSLGASLSGNNNLEIVSHLNARGLFEVLQSGPVVICRGGYSTLMDLAYAGNKVICIPTPGQTEQEYLCARLAEKQLLVYADQQDFTVSDLIIKAHKTKGIICNTSNNALQNAITGLFKAVEH